MSDRERYIGKDSSLRRGLCVSHIIFRVSSDREHTTRGAPPPPPTNYKCPSVVRGGRRRSSSPISWSCISHILVNTVRADDAHYEETTA